MKLEITATEKLTHLDGVPVRLWEGKTESGQKCHVFVHRIAVHEDTDPAEFERTLQAELPPGVTIPLRQIL